MHAGEWLQGLTVLITGGAGYIGSHMTLKRVNGGECILVLDNLSTGYGWAVPNGVPLIVGDVSDQELVSAVIRATSRRSVTLPLPPKSATRSEVHLFFDRWRLRESAANSGEGECPGPANLTVWAVEAYERNHVARRKPGA